MLRPLLHAFQEGGWPNLVIAFVGLAGLLVAVVALVLALVGSRAARPLGLTSLALAALLGLLGVGGTLLGRRTTADAISTASLTEAQRTRLRRRGYMEARSCSKFALGFAALPLLAGAVALFAGSRAPRPLRHGGSPPGPPSGAPPAPPAGGALAANFAILGAAAVSAAAPVATLALPLPGPDLPEGHPAWESLEEAGRAGQGEGGDAGADEPGPLGSLGVPGDAGFGPQMPGLLRTGGRSRLTIREGKIDVGGRLPPEIIRRIIRQNMGAIRRCYETGLAKKPDLAGEVTVRFVIGEDGALRGAAKKQSATLADEAAVSCVLEVFGRLTFPRPEGGVVVVTYPLVFEPLDADAKPGRPRPGAPPGG